MNRYFDQIISKKFYIKKLIKKFWKLEDMKMLKGNFMMIHVIHEMSVSLKITRITLKIVLQ